MRGLIRPLEGCGIAYIDFASQEIGIAAALSGDERMTEGYLEGDPYLAFAKAAQLVPPDATKGSHKTVRDRCKAIVLGINYGMGPDSMAAAAGITPAEAKELLRLQEASERLQKALAECAEDERRREAMKAEAEESLLNWLFAEPEKEDAL